LYKHYGKGFEVVEELPLPIVIKMLLHAKKKETEQQVYPLWLVHVLIASYKKEDIIPIDKMFDLKEKTTTNRTSEEILEEFAKIVEIDRIKKR
jgi:hypothetical protein